MRELRQQVDRLLGVLGQGGEARGFELFHGAGEILWRGELEIGGIAGKDEDGVAGGLGSAGTLTVADAEAIAREIREVAAVSPEAEQLRAPRLQQVGPIGRGRVAGRSSLRPAGAPDWYATVVAIRSWSPTARG